MLHLSRTNFLADVLQPQQLLGRAFPNHVHGLGKQIQSPLGSTATFSSDCSAEAATSQSNSQLNLATTSAPCSSATVPPPPPAIKPPRHASDKIAYVTATTQVSIPQEASQEEQDAFETAAVPGHAPDSEVQMAALAGEDAAAKEKESKALGPPPARTESGKTGTERSASEKGGWAAVKKNALARTDIGSKRSEGKGKSVKFSKPALLCRTMLDAIEMQIAAHSNE
jgi:hypothetical protein